MFRNKGQVVKLNKYCGASCLLLTHLRPFWVPFFVMKSVETTNRKQMFVESDIGLDWMAMIRLPLPIN